MSKEIEALIAELESLEKECSGMGRYALPARIKSAVAALRQQQGRGEPAAHMFPSDIEKFKTEETFAQAFSVEVGRPGEMTIPLFTHPPAAREPAGMVMVPVEPTDAMLTAGGLALGNHIKALVAKDPQQALNAKGKPRGLVIGWKEKMAIRYKAVIVAAKEK